jgi:hypothetical protein
VQLNTENFFKKRETTSILFLQMGKSERPPRDKQNDAWAMPDNLVVCYPGGMYHVSTKPSTKGATVRK